MSKKRTRHYGRVPKNLYTDPRSLTLSGTHLAVLVAVVVFADPDAPQSVKRTEAPEVGWLVDESGAPMDLERLAATTRFPESVVEKSLSKLEQVGWLVVSDAGAWGVIGWRNGIGENPNQRNVRSFRERQKAAAA